MFHIGFRTDVFNIGVDNVQGNALRAITVAGAGKKGGARAVGLRKAAMSFVLTLVSQSIVDGIAPKRHVAHKNQDLEEEIRLLVCENDILRGKVEALLEVLRMFGLKEGFGSCSSEVNRR